MVIKAAVLPEIGGPLLVEEVLLDPPEADEVLVRIAAAGVCHSDLHLAQGHLGYERVPIVLGHEGAGVVEAVGSEVRHVRPGDHVAFNFVPACGGCPSCRAGRPNLCETAAASSWKGTMLDGTTRLHRADGGPLLHFNFVSCFAEACVVPGASAVPIPPELAMTEAALLGCAVVTGVGAVRNAAGVRIGDSVCVIGCGGVGMQVVAAARSAGAARIIAVDRGPEKLEAALARGATHVVDALSEDVVRTGAAAVRRRRRSRVRGRRIAGDDASGMGRAASRRHRGGGGNLAPRLGGRPPRAGDAVPEGDQGLVLRVREPRVGDPATGRAGGHGPFPLADSVTTLTNLEGIQEGFERMLRGAGGRTVAVMDTALAKEELTA
jgi:S-(hydroxymethyl)glutathione dehydrogenase/alcohol dehydrogenase